MASCLNLDEAAMTLAEAATDVESGPEVMHVSAIQVDGTALFHFDSRCLLKEGIGIAVSGGGPPMGLGLLLEVLILLSAVGHYLVTNCSLLLILNI